MSMVAVRNVTSTEWDALWEKLPPTRRFANPDLSQLGYDSLWDEEHQCFWVHFTYRPPSKRDDDQHPPWFVKKTKTVTLYEFFGA